MKELNAIYFHLDSAVARTIFARLHEHANRLPFAIILLNTKKGKPLSTDSTSSPQGRGESIPIPYPTNAANTPSLLD